MNAEQKRKPDKRKEPSSEQLAAAREVRDGILWRAEQDLKALKEAREKRRSAALPAPAAASSTVHEARAVVSQDDVVSEPKQTKAESQGTGKVREARRRGKQGANASTGKNKKVEPQDSSVRPAAKVDPSKQAAEPVEPVEPEVAAPEKVEKIPTFFIQPLKEDEYVVYQKNDGSYVKLFRRGERYELRADPSPIVSLNEEEKDRWAEKFEVVFVEKKPLPKTEAPAKVTEKPPKKEETPTPNEWPIDRLLALVPDGTEFLLKSEGGSQMKCRRDGDDFVNSKNGIVTEKLLNRLNNGWTLEIPQKIPQKEEVVPVITDIGSPIPEGLETGPSSQEVPQVPKEVPAEKTLAEKIDGLRTQVELMREEYARTDYNRSSVWKKLKGFFGKNIHEDQKDSDTEACRIRYEHALTQLQEAELARLKEEGMTGQALKDAMAQTLFNFKYTERVDLFSARTAVRGENKSFSDKVIGTFERAMRVYNELSPAKKAAAATAILAGGVFTGTLWLAVAGGVMATDFLLEQIYESHRYDVATLEAKEDLEKIMEKQKKDERLSDEGLAHLDAVQKKDIGRIDEKFKDQKMDQAVRNLGSSPVALGVGAAALAGKMRVSFPESEPKKKERKKELSKSKGGQENPPEEKLFTAEKALIGDAATYVEKNPAEWLPLVNMTRELRQGIFLTQDTENRKEYDYFENGLGGVRVSLVLNDFDRLERDPSLTYNRNTNPLHISQMKMLKRLVRASEKAFGSLGRVKENERIDTYTGRIATLALQPKRSSEEFFKE